MGTLENITHGTEPPRYAAFISYAHSDERRAAKLHRMIEGYRPPKELKQSRALLRPVFRDKAELTASHSLSDDIKAAVKGSRKLIVLCSPAAKISQWVNEEIRLFRAVHGEAAILCALVEGTPDTAFPPALTEGGREPLAANLSGSHESFRYGMLQLCASLLGVGLDDLVRRDARRRRRAGSLAILSALAFSSIMAGSTLHALKAQKLAEANRAEAEGLVEYMITDLKAKLEPVGRLDIVGGLGDKVMDYYSGQTLADMPDDRIARQARAQHLLGQVALDAGRYEQAQSQIDAAYALTKEVLARNPNDTDAIFAHAQSAFWVGNLHKKQNNFEATKPYWQEYNDLADHLYSADENNFHWILEAAWGENNMGIVNRETGKLLSAEKNYKSAIELFENALLLRPDEISVRQELANSLTGAEQTFLQSGRYIEAMKYKRQTLDILLELSKTFSSNKDYLADVAANQSNFLWQYNLFLTDLERANLIGPPWEILKNLTQHDPENILWYQRYIWHLLLVSVHADSITEKQKAWNELSIELAPSEQGDPIVYFFNDVRAQKLLAAGLIGEARSLIEEMTSAYLAKPEVYGSGKIILSKLYTALGDSATATRFANEVIESNSRAPSNYPENILHLAQAYLIIGDCEKAIDVIAPIRAVAAAEAPEIKTIMSCQT